MSGTVKELTDATFQKEVGRSKEPVVVEFYTNSCPNCRAMEPIIRELAEELSDSVVFAKLNAQSNPRSAALHGVMGVPTFKIFCSGRPIGEMVGAAPATILRNTIKDLAKRKRECITGSTPISYEMDGYG